MHPSSSRVIPKRAEQERAKQVEFEFGAYTTESHHWCGEMIMCVVVAPSLSASAVPENVKKWAVNHNEERSCLLALQPQQVAAPEAVGRQWPVIFGNMISLQWAPREKGVWREEGSKLSGWFLLGFFFHRSWVMLPSHSQFLAPRKMDRLPFRSRSCGCPAVLSVHGGRKDWVEVCNKTA